MKKIRSILLLLLFIFFTSCSEFNEASDIVDSILSERPNAVSEIEKILETKKIIFVGSDDHNLINDVIFFNKENLQRFYNKGLRYILFEGDVPDDEKQMMEQQVMIFYPWENVAVQYYEHPILKNIAEINSSLTLNEKIKVVGLERGRTNFTIDNKDEKSIYNYRDEFMFKTAKEFIDNSDDDDKFLILCGAAHGYIKSVNRNGFEWKTLGSYLKNEYKNDFVSLDYIAIDSVTIDSIYFDALKNSEKWYKTNYIERIININDIKNINKKIKIFFDDNYQLYDYFIADKHSKYGIKYCYKLADPDVYSQVIQETVSIYNNLKKYNYDYDYSNPEVSYKIENLLKNLYYLKFQFGDSFEYNFWNPSKDLLSAINSLKFEKTKQEYSDSVIKEYQMLIRAMYYIRYSDIGENVSFYMKHGKKQIKEASNLIPKEIWSDYWNAIMNYKCLNYKESLKFCNNYLANSLAYSSQALPEILNIAIVCSKKNNSDFEIYKSILDNLSNELKIDVTKTHLFLY